MQNKPSNSRAVAVGILARWLKSGDFPDRMVDEVTHDHAFVKELVHSAVKRWRTLEWALGKFTKGQSSARTLPFLLAGSCQLLFMPGVEQYAAVDETVGACVAELGRKPSGFVNAVLRKIATNRERLLSELAAQPVAVRESYPELIVRRWRRRFGDARTAALCEWSNRPPEVSIRVNRRKMSAETLISQMKDLGQLARPHPFAPDSCIILPRGVKVHEIPGYTEGAFAVQDPSTTVPVEILDPKPGESVLDACASPGGKTLMIAERMLSPGGAAGRLVAMDLRDDRMERLRSNIARMGFDRIEIVVGDAAGAKNALGGAMFDAVLADVPCSNTGVLNRRPDARWRFSLQRMEGLARTQRAILDGLADVVKPGGRLVYSNCSIEHEESGGLVAEWVRSRRDFVTASERLLIPPESGTDGAYAVLLKRT